MRTWAEISLGNLEHNVRAMQARLPEGCRYLGVVKADAYGHGAVPVAQRLEQMGISHLAVACYEEALQLRQAGIRAQILILGPGAAWQAREVAALGNVCQAVGSLRLARELSQNLEGSGLTLPVHLKLDTGMSRTGFSLHHENGLDEAAEAMLLPHLEVQGAFTHFASSDEPDKRFTQYQHRRFLNGTLDLERMTGKKFSMLHCANSGAMVNHPMTYMDMVRPGLAQYGLYPCEDERGDLVLKPVMRLMTRVAEITDHIVGDTISYGRTYLCEKEQRFAVLPIGYADGLMRSLSGKLTVRINGKPAPQCGRICMDMCMVDITHLPDVQVGDEVEIFGGEQSVDVLAEAAGTISYELLCSVSPRVPRVYTE